MTNADGRKEAVVGAVNNDAKRKISSIDALILIMSLSDPPYHLSHDQGGKVQTRDDCAISALSIVSRHKSYMVAKYCNI
jgi:hypothetical protein